MELTASQANCFLRPEQRELLQEVSRLQADGELVKLTGGLRYSGLPEWPKRFHKDVDLVVTPESREVVSSWLAKNKWRRSRKRGPDGSQWVQGAVGCDLLVFEKEDDCWSFQSPMHTEIFLSEDLARFEIEYLRLSFRSDFWIVSSCLDFGDVQVEALSPAQTLLIARAQTPREPLIKNTPAREFLEQSLASYGEGIVVQENLVSRSVHEAKLKIQGVSWFEDDDCLESWRYLLGDSLPDACWFCLPAHGSQALTVVANEVHRSELRNSLLRLGARVRTHHCASLESYIFDNYPKRLDVFWNHSERGTELFEPSWGLSSICLPPIDQEIFKDFECCCLTDSERELELTGISSLPLFRPRDYPISREVTHSEYHYRHR